MLEAPEEVGWGMIRLLGVVLLRCLDKLEAFPLLKARKLQFIARCGPSHLAHECLKEHPERSSLNDGISYET